MGVWTGGFIALGFSRIRSTPSRRSLGPESVRSMHGFMGTWADGFMGAWADGFMGKHYSTSLY